MTKRECAVIMAFTGVCMLKGDDLKYFYEYVFEIMGRPIFTHEIAKYADEIKEKAKPDFIRICAEATNQRQPAPCGFWNVSTAIRFDPIRKERSPVTAIICSRCSCGYIPDNGVNDKSKYYYCPSCGADMREHTGGAENGR